MKIITGWAGSLTVLFALNICDSNIRNHIIYKYLMRLGNITMYIYILHPFIIAALKNIMLRSILGNILPALWLAIMGVSGICIPIIFSMAANKIWLLDIPFHPRKYVHRVKQYTMKQ